MQSVYQKSFFIPQFGSPCLCLGCFWSPAFITICVSLGVQHSAPPPGGTYTNEDTTSNEHPPPSVLNYRAVPLPEPTQHPVFQLKPKCRTNLFVPKSRNRRRMSVSAICCCCSRYTMFGGCSSEAVCACLCVGKRVFVHYTVSCAII